MADLSRKTASIYINHAAADEALKKLQTQADKLTASIKKGEDAGKNMVKEIGKLNTTKDQIAAVQRQIDQGLKPSFNQLQTLVAKTRAELKKMSESDPGFIQKAKDLNKYSTELSRLGQQIGAVNKEGGGFKGMIADMLPALGWTAAGAAVIGFFKGAVDEALEADKAAGKFRGTLENLGKADAFDRLSQKAEDMAARFKFIDSPDVVNVFDKLITYGKLTEAQITALTPVIINFASKSRISLDESASVIIKALEGNGKALKEYGINIKDAKTESERLAVVMEDLGHKVNGAADAFGSTTAGKIAETQQSIKDLKEEIGTGLLPVIKRVLEGVNSLIDGIKWAFTTSSKSMQQLSKEILDKENVNIAEQLATQMGQKSIADQKRLAESYKAIYISSQKALSDFLQSSDKNNVAERNRLLQNQEQDEQIYLASQRTLQESIVQAKKNANAESKKDEDEAAAEAKKRREEALQLAAAQAKELQKIWDDLKNRIYDVNALEDNPVVIAFNNIQKAAEKDLVDAKKLLDQKVINQQQYSDAIVRIEQIRYSKIAELNKKYNLSSYSPDPNNLSQLKPLTATGPLATTNANAASIEADRQKKFIDDLAGYQLKSMQASGKKKLQADLDLLDVQQAQELANKDLTENQKLVIEEKYRQKRGAAEKDYQGKTASMIIDVAGKVANIYSMFSQLQEAADEAKLEDNQRRYDEDKNKLDRQLRQKLVSQKEYDRQLRALDDKKRKEDAEIKRKQFERDKAAQIVSAIMDGASAVVAALGTKPFLPLGPIMAGLAGAMAAAQIAIISSQKAPQFAKGGMFDGPSHAAGGMPIYSRGRKVAEVEGGEAFLSRDTVKNNPEIVNELLRASMYGNGRRITPYWQNRSSYSPLNYSSISRSMDNVRHFAKGGIMPEFNNNSTSTDQSDVNSILPGIVASVDILYQKVSRMEDKLSGPIKAYTLLSDANAAQQMDDKIRQQTTMTR